MLIDKIKLISGHYEKVHACNKCFNCFGCSFKHDSLKVRRKVLEGALDSKIFIIAQSIAERTQRLSGLPYTYTNGQLSTTGKKLDKYLSLIGYTIIPNNGRKLVYSSDIVHCYPGKKNNGDGDNKPTSQEIKNCYDWLTKEIEIIKPKVLLLLGKVAAETFLSLFCKEELDNFELLLNKKFKIKINHLNLNIFILPHPASMYPNLSNIYKTTMDLIKLSF